MSAPTDTDWRRNLQRGDRVVYKTLSGEEEAEVLFVHDDTVKVHVQHIGDQRIEADDLLRKLEPEKPVSESNDSNERWYFDPDTPGHTPTRVEMIFTADGLSLVRMNGSVVAVSNLRLYKTQAAALLAAVAHDADQVSHYTRRLAANLGRAIKLLEGKK